MKNTDNSAICLARLDNKYSAFQDLILNLILGPVSEGSWARLTFAQYCS